LLWPWLLCACGTETIVHRLAEKEANEIVVLLARNEIHGMKVVIDTGREVLYDVSVGGGDRLRALGILGEHNYPRKPITGYGEVFSQGGLIPTSAEEKAKKIRALEGEIERQLMLVDGVLDAEVNIVMPDENALRTGEEAATPTTASVVLKYLPGADNRPPLEKEQVTSLVAAAVEKLDRSRVEVILAPVGGNVAGKCPACPEGGTGLLCTMSERAQKLLVAAAMLVLILFGLFLVYGQMRLVRVRSRLIRLQNEIARARRKPGELEPGEAG
jgi:type III secretion protein J